MFISFLFSSVEAAHFLHCDTFATALMSRNSPGQGSSPWSASLQNDDLPLDLFLRSGVSSIPVALVPLGGASIRLNNPKATQEQLHAVTPNYQSITDVRQFGRGGIVCRSPDQACVADLLKCSSFASVPVSAYIPPHLACTKGIVRGVDSQLSPSETLEKLSMAGVVAVYRCNRVVDNKRVPTESVIATFAGTSCPSEIKAWPLIFRVDALASRPLQCRNCWRYGHSAGGCKSGLRCCTCGEGHSNSDCTSQDQKCCLCDGSHPADYSDCPARVEETQVLEIIDKRRCSRREAIATIKERTHGYASVTARHPSFIDATLTQAINAAVEKAMANAMERLVVSISECISQVVNTQIANILQLTTAMTPDTSKLPPIRETRDINNVGALPSENSHENSASSSKPDQHTLDLHVSTDVDLDARAQKRSRSPLNRASSMSPQNKSKKSPPSTVLKENILEKVVASAILSSK